MNKNLVIKSKTIAQDNTYEVIDLVSQQAEELYEILNTNEVRQGSEWSQSQKYIDFLEDEKINAMYITYPILEKVIRVVSEESYWKLITDRNRGVYSDEIIRQMKDLKIGLYGLSVGSNIALLCGKTGFGKEYFISDLDKLETTNLNRVLAELTDIGTSKVDFVERKLYGFNPYLVIHKFSEGVQEYNIDAALNYGNLDFIVEEIDSFPMKIAVRQFAREHKIPVLMIVDNGEGVVLIVERYDMGYTKIWEQEDSYWEERLKNLSGPGEFADIVINHNVGGMEEVDPNMLQAVPRVIAGELVSWPQIGSAAVLGAVIVGYAIKEILGGNLTDGFYRTHINISDIIK